MQMQMQMRQAAMHITAAIVITQSECRAFGKNKRVVAEQIAYSVCPGREACWRAFRPECT